MSSEAAYFADALASTPTTLELSHHVSEPAAEPIDLSRSPDEVSERISRSVIRASEASDESLLELICGRDEVALGGLFRRHARAVRNIASRILKDEAEADDLVQEVFLTIFRKAGQYDPAQGKASSWIIHLAYHKAFDRKRYLKSRHFYATEEVDSLVHPIADPRREPAFHESTLEGILGREATAEFRSRLSAEQQETLQLFFFEGYALKEIAERTGRSLVLVRSHYYRGLERLREIVIGERPRAK